MFKYIFSLLIALSFVACVQKQPDVVKSSKKVFDKEDIYILYALDLEKRKKFKEASNLFETLYKKSLKKEYIYRAFQNLVDAKEYKLLIDRFNSLKLQDVKLIRYKIFALLNLKRYKESNKEALELIKISKTKKDYIILADTYINLKEYKTAMNYLQKAYKIDFDDALVDKIALLEYRYFDEKQKAIKTLESHVLINGCSKITCDRLLLFYSNNKDLDGLLSTYLRYYKIKKTKELAHKIVQLYILKKDYLNLLSFLEKTGSYDEALLNLYITMKKYDKASRLAYKLYLKKADYFLLGQSAIYEYEASSNKNKVVKDVVDKLELVIKKDNNSLFLNYLGYILIDHEIDIKKGIFYVKEALKQDPKSFFYIDSLAWGEYKLNHCKKAKELIQKVLKYNVSNNKEVMEHLKAIKSCKLNKKDKK